LTFGPNGVDNPLILVSGGYRHKPRGPCKMVGPILEEISDEMSDQVIIAKHNIDEQPNQPTKYGVRGRWRPSLLDWGDQF